MARPHRPTSKQPSSPTTTRNVGEVLVDLDGTRQTTCCRTRNVTVTVTISSVPDALSMPREALHEQNGTDFVYKVVDGELQRVTIKSDPKPSLRFPFSPGSRKAMWSPPEQPTEQPLQEGVPIKEVR